MSFSKYGAVKTGGSASKLESAVKDMLWMRSKAGEIRDIQEQKRIELVAGIHWRIDFYYFDIVMDRWCFAEAKGFETSDYRLKLRLYKWFGPCILYIWKGSYKKLLLDETVIPVYGPIDDGDMREIQTVKRSFKMQSGAV